MRVLLVHHQAPVRRRLRQLLGEYANSEIVGEADNPGEAQAAIRKHAPDLLFLAVQFPERSGFEILSALPGDERPLTMFVAPPETTALHAFEQHGIDYLLEPLDRNRFRAAYENVRDVMKSSGSQRERGKLGPLLEQLAREASGESAVTPSSERILVKSGSRARFLNTHEIDWIEAAGNYVKLHVSGDDYIVRESISKLESRLCEKRFARVHRSMIVNLDRVRELRPWFSGEMIVVLHDGTELKLSRSYRKELERRVRV